VYSQTQQELVYSTYIGGDAMDRVNDIARNQNGMVFVVGRTYSTYNLSTENVHQENYNGEMDGFIAAYNSLFSLQWCTYFGGIEYDEIFVVDVLSDNSIVVTGRTFSADSIATPGSYQEEIGLFGDAFLSRFSEDGILLWSTYYGGNNGDFSNCVAVDEFDNIYIAGVLNSDSLGSAGVYQEYRSGGAWDAFISKFSEDGNLIWTSYFGGSGGDDIVDIVINSNSSICILGQTNSVDSISTENIHQDSLGGSFDSFISVIDSTGNIEWSTYYGGGQFDDPFAISVDNSNNIIVCGYSSSTSGISTSGAHKEVNDYSDLFLASFSPVGMINWGTYFGGPGSEYFKSDVIAIGTDIIFSGTTNSETGISTEYAFQQEKNPSIYEDAFLVKFNEDGEQVWGTYFGSEGSEGARGLSFIDESTVLLGMGSTSLTNMVTEDAYQSENNGSSDGVFSVFDIDIEVGINEVVRFDATVYPNPATSSITVSIKDRINIEGKLEIITVEGKRVVRLDNYITNTALSIDITPGLYIVKLLIQDDLYISKLIVE
jgi:hypothetical protein